MSNGSFSDLEPRSIEITKSGNSCIVRKQMSDCLGPGAVRDGVQMNTRRLLAMMETFCILILVAVSSLNTSL